MLRRNILLVGRVNGNGGLVWNRDCVNAKLENLYESRKDLFQIYKKHIYLLLCKEVSDMALDALGNSIAIIVGNGPFESVKEVSCTVGTFSAYIKQNAVCVGEMVDGEVSWVEDTWALGISQKTMIEQWSREVSCFEVLDNKIYYIKPKQEVVEDLYFKCVEIAGSELRLAKALARNIDDVNNAKKQMLRNVSAFRRFSFAHRKTFAHYVDLFTKYLSDHEMPTDGLFASAIYGKSA